MLQMSPTTVEVFMKKITDRLLLTIIGSPDNQESERIQMCPTAAGPEGTDRLCYFNTLLRELFRQKDGVDVGHADDAFVHLSRAFWTE